MWTQQTPTLPVVTVFHVSGPRTSIVDMNSNNSERLDDKDKVGGAVSVGTEGTIEGPSEVH